MRFLLAKNGAKYRLAKDNEQYRLSEKVLKEKVQDWFKNAKGAITTADYDNDSLILHLPEMPDWVKDYLKTHLPSVRLGINRNCNIKFQSSKKPKSRGRGWSGGYRRIPHAPWVFPSNRPSLGNNIFSPETKENFIKQITLDELESGEVECGIGIISNAQNAATFTRVRYDKIKEKWFCEFKLVLLIHETDFDHYMDSTECKIYVDWTPME